MRFQDSRISHDLLPRHEFQDISEAILEKNRDDFVVTRELRGKSNSRSDCSNHREKSNPHSLMNAIHSPPSRDSPLAILEIKEGVEFAGMSLHPHFITEAKRDE